MVEKAELEGWLQAEIAGARGYESSELAQLFDDALMAYRGELAPSVPSGRTDVQSNDVADMVEAIVAQVLPAFSLDAVAEFEPMSDDDVERVQAESDAVNDVIAEQNNGYTMFQEALRDALLVRNGWTAVELEERKAVIEDTYEEIDELAADEIVANAAEAGEIEKVERKSVGEGLVDLEVRYVVEEPLLKVRAADPVCMSWNMDHDNVFVQGLRFLSELYYPTRGELIADGYNREWIDNVPPYTGARGTAELQRDPERGRSQDVLDPSTQRVRARRIHYRYDSDGDGIAELHRILFLEDGSAGESILEDEIVEFIPYATGTPILQPHRLDGLGVYDKLKEVEKGKTHVLRQWLDNQRTANQPHMVVNTNLADAEDFMTRRPSGVSQADGPPADAVMVVPVQDIGGSCLTALDYFDKIRSERSGAALDLMARQQMVAGDTAHGIERQISQKELMAAMMTRTLAETLVRQTYLLVHRGMRKWLNKPITVRSRGRMVQVNPATWPERERVNVKTGLSVAERNAKRMTLEQVIAYQVQLYTAGKDGEMVDDQGVHNALLDWTRASMLDNGERYWLDPSSDESQQAAAAKREEQQGLQNVQLQIAAQAASAESDAQAVENAFQAWKLQREQEFEAWKEVLSAELELVKQGDPAGSGEDVTELQRGGAAVAASGG